MRATFIPFAGIAIWALDIVAMINEAYTFVVLIILLFITLQSLLSPPAIEIDEEDIQLVAYAPFFVMGYKHLIDALTIKALFPLRRYFSLIWG